MSSTASWAISSSVAAECESFPTTTKAVCNGISCLGKLIEVTNHRLYNRARSQGGEPINGVADLWPLARRILLAQAAAGLVVALVAWGGWGGRAAVSALAGAVTGVVANLFMTLTSLEPARSSPGALGRLMLGQLTKVVATVALFVAANRLLHVVWPAMLLAYFATLVMFWWVPFAAPPRRKD